MTSRQVPAPRRSQNARPCHKDRKRPGKSDEIDSLESGELSCLTKQTPLNRRGQVSLNHLLNFSYSPREPIGQHRRHITRHLVDKARYIHANYRFVVSPHGDYRAQCLDSDLPIPWENIIQVIASETQCPICLDFPVAPRIAKCGHIFCFPCIIRYFASQYPVDDRFKRWRKCPICWDSVYIDEMKPVKWIQVDESNIPRVNTDVALRLMRREQGSTLVLPRDNTDVCLADGEIPWYCFRDVVNYARIMKANQEYVTAESKREIVELQDLESRDSAEFGKDGDWNSQAIERIINSMPDQMEEHPPKAKQIPPLNPFYFYQPRSALHFYLSPLDIRILKSQFGSFSEFPNNLLVRIEAIQQNLTIDDDFRKRMRYLAHLPRGCEVSLLECNWDGIVSDSVLQSFQTEIQTRRKKRLEKKKSEDRARLQAEKTTWEQYPMQFLPKDACSLNDFSPDSSSNISTPESNIKRPVWGKVTPLPEEETLAQGLNANWELQLANLDIKKGKKKLVILSNATKRAR